MGRKSQLQRNRQRILKLQSFACFYCDRQLSYTQATVDHVQPSSIGGRNWEGNFVVACGPCNSRRGVMSLRVMLNVTSSLATLPKGDKWKKTREMLTHWTNIELNKTRARYNAKQRNRLQLQFVEHIT